MKSRDEIKKLKKSWTSNPCWDIEDTEGFEEHKGELRKYRFAMEAKWREEHERKAAADHLAIAKQLLAGDVHPVENGNLSRAAIAHAMIAQVEATQALVKALHEIRDITAGYQDYSPNNY